MFNFDISQTMIGKELIAEGEKKGEKKGEINTLRKLYRQKILTKEQYDRRVKPLMKQLESL